MAGLFQHVERDVQENNCLPCERIAQIQAGANPYFVAELETGYVVLGDYQFYKGYTLFLCKEHKTELHQLDPDFRLQFLKDISDVAEAVYQAFQPEKLNYELLGNGEPHLHWHIFPRYADDPMPGKPIWQLDKAIRTAVIPTEVELKELKEKLRTALKKTAGLPV